jgi:hypothetical protein
MSFADNSTRLSGGAEFHIYPKIYFTTFMMGAAFMDDGREVPVFSSDVMFSFVSIEKRNKSPLLTFLLIGAGAHITTDEDFDAHISIVPIGYHWGQLIDCPVLEHTYSGLMLAPGFDGSFSVGPMLFAVSP